jgi:hypothetical protein
MDWAIPAEFHPADEVAGFNGEAAIGVPGRAVGPMSPAGPARKGSSYAVNAVGVANGSGHEGTAAVRMGIAAAHAMPTASTQCLTAAERRRKRNDIASAPNTSSEIFIGCLLSLLFQ